MAISLYFFYEVLLLLPPLKQYAVSLCSQVMSFAIYDDSFAGGGINVYKICAYDHQ